MSICANPRLFLGGNFHGYAPGGGAVLPAVYAATWDGTAFGTAGSGLSGCRRAPRARRRSLWHA
ncbi:MAG: hypothetical protein R3F11_20485 [Verrucomicrobiales bacterium]